MTDRSSMTEQERLRDIADRLWEEAKLAEKRGDSKAAESMKQLSTDIHNQARKLHDSA